MKFNTFASSNADIQRCARAENLDEVLLEPHLLARQGQLSEQAARDLALEANQHGLRPVLVWDIVMPERVMAAVSEELKHWDLSCYAAIRVCDLGAAQWLQSHRPTMPIQLIVETGSHNQEALRGWIDIFAPNLERLILSIELPEEKLVELCRDLPTPCEVLGLGQILLFYSPRSLLAPHLAPIPKSEQPGPLYLEATAASEKSSFKPFPTLETQHGTMMFLDKDQFILDRVDALRQAGLHTLRLDLRQFGRDGHVALGLEEICRRTLTDAASLRAEWPHKTRAPFFKANKTTAQFSRMKPSLHQYRDETCLAELVAGEKGKHVVFYTLRAFDLETVYSLVLPTDEEIELPPDLKFRTLDGAQPDVVEAEQILITPWIKKACAGALLRGRTQS